MFMLWMVFLFSEFLEIEIKVFENKSLYSIGDIDSLESITKKIFYLQSFCKAFAIFF